MTNEMCISAARAALPATTYQFAGVEYGKQCYAGTVAPTSTTLVGTKACTMTCAGNIVNVAKETCGGKKQYNLWGSVTGGSPAWSMPVVTATP